jgi:nucleotide-binding universal stress UspA family protein
MLDDFEQSPLDTAEKVTARLEEICRQVVKKNGVSFDLIANVRVSEHAPKAAILTAADEFEADLIIMGSHRHTVVADALLGSTTMKILHSAKVPVLVVRIPEALS